MHFLQELEPAHPSNIMQEQAFCGGGGGSVNNRGTLLPITIKIFKIFNVSLIGSVGTKSSKEDSPIWFLVCVF